MKYISASQINIYSNCSRQYYFHYIEKILKPTSSPHLAFGSALHGALEKLNISMGSVLLTLSEVFQEFDKIWKESIEKEEIIFKGNMHDDLYDIGLKSLELYYKEFLNYEPIIYKNIVTGEVKFSAECEFKVPIYDLDGNYNENYDLYGFIDLVLKKDNNIYIVDHKTAKEKYKDFDINTSIQLSLYSYAFREMIKQGCFPDLKRNKEDYVMYNVFVKNYKNHKPEIQQCNKKIMKRDINNIVYIINNFIKGIENEIWLPNFGSHCNWMCDYKEECEKFKLSSKKLNLKSREII